MAALKASVNAVYVTEYLAQSATIWLYSDTMSADCCTSAGFSTADMIVSEAMSSSLDMAVAASVFALSAADAASSAAALACCASTMAALAALSSVYLLARVQSEEL